jgi:hypothetical protein
MAVTSDTGDSISSDEERRLRNVSCVFCLLPVRAVNGTFPMFCAACLAMFRMDAILQVALPRGASIPLVPRRRFRNTDGFPMLARAFPRRLREYYRQAFTYQGVDRSAWHSRCSQWRACSVEITYKRGRRTNEMFVRLLLGEVHPPFGPPYLDAGWHVTLCHLRGEVDVWRLQEWLDEWSRPRNLQRLDLLFCLAAVSWEPPRMYEHFELTGDFCAFAETTRCALRQAFFAFLSPRRRRLGQLHLAIPVSGAS